MKPAKLILALMIVSTLAPLSGCGSTKPVIKEVAVPVEKVVYRPTPEHLLRQLCRDVRLSDSVTRADFEARAVKLWTCVQQLNEDKVEIGALR